MLKAAPREKGTESYSSIGIDIGSRSVNLIQLKKIDDEITIHAAAMRDIKIEETDSDACLCRALEEMKAEGRFVNKTVVTRMPHTQTTIIPIQLEEGTKEIEAALIKEAPRYLPYEIENAVIDYIPMHQDNSKTQKVMLVATKREDVDRHIHCVKKAGFEIEAIDVGPNALLRLFRSLPNIEDRILLINVGTHRTFFTIIWDGDIIIDRSVEWGETCLVETLVKELDLKPEEALRMLYSFGIKHQEGAPLFSYQDTETLSDATIANAIYQATAKDLEEFVAEAEKVLLYCASENRGTMVDQTYFFGGGEFVKDLYPFLESRLGIRAKTMSPFKFFQGDFKNPYNPAYFSVSIGLALRGFENQAVKNDA